MGGFIVAGGGSGGGSSGSATGLGARLAYASPAGGAVAAAPAGFNGLIGRLLVTLPAGTATWVSLTAGADAQLLVVVNADAANTLILPGANFVGFGNLNLLPGMRALLYYDATAAAWEQTS